jgi:hypothetical protein
MRTRSFSILLIATLIYACSDNPKQFSIYDDLPISPYENRCDTIDSVMYDQGIDIGKVDALSLPELSGLCASSVIGYFWAINDSGNDPYLYLISRNGSIEHVIDLGIDLIDPEDICLARSSIGNIIYIADTGNNKKKRENLSIITLSESTALRGFNYAIKSDTVFRINPDSIQSKNLSIEEDLFDIEAMMFEETTNTIYLVTKREDKNIVFKATESRNGFNAIPIARIPYFFITAADISHDSRRMLMKSYHYVFLWQNDHGVAMDSLLMLSPKCLPYEPEPQGETIAFGYRDYSYYTISEAKNNVAEVSIMYYQSKK